MSRRKDSFTDNRICVICNRHFIEHGNNAQPVRPGQCCNKCNDEVVIPARLRAMREQREGTKT